MSKQQQIDTLTKELSDLKNDVEILRNSLAQVVKETNRGFNALAPSLATVPPIGSLGPAVSDLSPVIFRHVRWWDFCDKAISNLHGITFAFQINYRNNTVRAGWSLCNDYNFDAAYGRHVAAQRLVEEDRTVTMPYDQTRSLVDNLISALTGACGPYAVNEKYYILRNALRKYQFQGHE